MRLRILRDNEAAIEMKNGIPVCSISEISRLLGVDRATVAKSIRKHGIKPSGIRRANPIYPLPAVARRVLSQGFW